MTSVFIEFKFVFFMKKLNVESTTCKNLILLSYPSIGGLIFFLCCNSERLLRNVVIFDVFDSKHEVSLDYDNRPYTFIDQETGDRIKLNPTSIKEVYEKRMKKFIHNLEVKCGQYKIDFVQCDVNEGFYPVLLQYMVKRQGLY